MVGKAAIKRKTIENMKQLGVYKPEYDPVIDIYSELCEQYQKLTKQFKDGGYKYYEYTTQGGTKKSAIVATLETLRKDILAYSDRLCINPKALETVTPEHPNHSKLAKVLGELSEKT